MSLELAGDFISRSCSCQVRECAFGDSRETSLKEPLTNNLISENTRVDNDFYGARNRISSRI